MILPLVGVVKHYPWGTTDYIPHLLGRGNPENRPFAELWFGSHPAGPALARLPDGRAKGLTELLASRATGDLEGARLLGPTVVDRFGPRLPFLLKVLSAARPLSIQVHPDAESARTGYDRENAAGIPDDSPHRLYHDPYHKPELIVALTEFYAMAGFRPQAELEVELDGISALGALSGRDLRGLVSALLRTPAPRAAVLVDATVERLAGRRDERADWVRLLAAAYPGDAGVLAPLYLNLVRLSPGEALYLDAGALHAYLRGTGIEIMAASDNVLRGGLTTKPIDVEELLRVVRWEARAKPVLHAVPLGGRDGEYLYPTPSAEFELRRIDFAEDRRIDVESVEILLAIDGNWRLRPESGGAVVELSAGHAVLIGADEKDPRLDGRGTLFRARVPRKVRIWVDADSCPARVRDTVARAAVRTGLPAVFVANREIPVRTGEAVRMVVVGGTDGAADRFILDECRPGDIAVTRDIPMAAGLVERGVVALNDRGDVYTRENVRERLSVRDFMKDLRERGLYEGGTASYGSRELASFARAFDRELARALKAGN